jgi:hypothetical protein
VIVQPVPQNFDEVQAQTSPRDEALPRLRLSELARPPDRPAPSKQEFLRPAGKTDRYPGDEEGGAMGGSWRGWILFAGWMMVLVGTLDFFQGLIAVIRDEYYVLTANQIVVFDLTTWGWTLVSGLVVALAGLGILAGAGWARWFAIVVGSLNFIVELGFVGSARYPLWALTVLALTVVVLYALIVRWDEARLPV